MPKRDDPDLFTPAPLPIAKLEPEQRLACLRLIRSDNVGPVTFRELINHYGGAVQALDALPELARRGGRTLRICPTDRAERELEAAAKIGAEIVFTIEPGYPALLAHVEAPPPAVYLKGDARLLGRPAIAIVGSRLASAAGITLARRFAGDLGKRGFVTVSGLARGIDAAVHEASLATGTIAVVAGGIDYIYPPENARLQAAIAERGCLLTEMPPGFEPRAKDFPRRNRLVSGMAHGVVVVEAARRSGTLSTARMAGEQGREVFAVPGHPLDPRAEGTNHLLKNGATLVTCADDVLDALAPVIAGTALAMEPHAAFEDLPPATIRPPPLIGGSDRDRVVVAMGPNPIPIDDLARATELGARELRVILMELDLAGRIERHGQGLVSLKPEAAV
ncbi:MAG: DNA protecting protein DprA [Hyphomicrobium sp. 32-62-53]|nr:MAG: DNA protecting protein DprA [Hyphomicrobium sp. 12-62-95]OYY00359.1 MAG: DNA protecting protein DprA [Hyphomicrobium sp. 32-62-53]